MHLGYFNSWYENSIICKLYKFAASGIASGLWTCFSCPDLVVQFNPVSYTVSESGGSVTLMLETDKQFEYPFTVDVNTADGTAVGEPHTHLS